MKMIAVAVGAVLVLAGCVNGLRFKEVPEGNVAVDSLDQAGSVHVSVISVMPWAEVKEKMRPKLTSDEQTARAQAVPVTFAMLDRYLDILRLQASIAPSVVKSTESTTFTSATGQEDSESTSRTTTKEPGTARDTPLPDALPLGSKPADLAASASAINSSLNARAIASYLQEIQALNSEVDHAAQRTNMVPYLLRVQVSVMPLRRHLGYDVYSNLSFFSYASDMSGRSPTPDAPFVVPLLSSDSIETSQRSQNIEAIRDIGIALDLIKGFGSVGASVGSQKDRQQALAGLDVNSVMTMGRLSDNSLRVRFGAAYDPGGGFATHPRTNTISVLVYLPKATEQVRVVSRQSWIHVLTGQRLSRGTTAYQDRLQEILNQFAGVGLTKELLESVDEYTLTGRHKDFSDALADARCRADQSAANAAARAAASPAASAQVAPAQPPQCLALTGAAALEQERRTAYIWSALLGLLPGSSYSTNVLDISSLKPICPISAQLVSYQEDDNGLSVTLAGASELDRDKLKAALHLGHAPKSQAPAGAVAQDGSKKPQAQAAKGGKKAPASSAENPAEPEKVIAPTASIGALVASSIEVSSNRQTTKLTFATKDLAALPWTGSAGLQPVAVELSGCALQDPKKSAYAFITPALPNSQVYDLGAKLAKTKKAAPRITVTLSAPGSSVIADKNRNGIADVIVGVADDDKSSYAISANGAPLRDVAPAANVQARGDGTWVVKQPGALRLSLANLVENQTVDVEVRKVDNNKVGDVLRKQPILVRAAPAR